LDIEEILVYEMDKGWGKRMPVKLITYGGGVMDIHRQTGDQFEEHIRMADKILAERGLTRVIGEWFIGPSGAYQSVKPIDKGDKPSEV